jgi:surface protein
MLVNCALNQPLGGWNTSSATTMSNMFNGEILSSFGGRPSPLVD